MPIRFQCDVCNQRLSIARRKAGVRIECPTCGRELTVPNEEGDSGPIESSPGTSTARGQDTGPDRGEETPDESVFIAPPSIPTVPETIEAIPSIRLIPKGPPPSLSETQPPPPPPETLPPAPPIARRASPWPIYCQALILAAVAIGGFAAGYYLGRQDASPSALPPPLAAARPAPTTDDGFRNEEVLLQGRMRWMPTVGQTAGDREAVLLLLPQDKFPAESLPIEGLRPADAPPAGDSASLRRIQELGGICTKAADDGTVAAVLPREGRYHLLLISRNTSRPKEEAIRPKDLVEMKQYFGEAEKLIGGQKYVWKQEEIRVGFPPLEHDFGLDGLP